MRADRKNISRIMYALIENTMNSSRTPAKTSRMPGHYEESGSAQVTLILPFFPLPRLTDVQKLEHFDCMHAFGLTAYNSMHMHISKQYVAVLHVFH